MKFLTLIVLLAAVADARRRKTSMKQKVASPTDSSGSDFQQMLNWSGGADGAHADPAEPAPMPSPTIIGGTSNIAAVSTGAHSHAGMSTSTGTSANTVATSATTPAPVPSSDVSTVATTVANAGAGHAVAGVGAAALAIAAAMAV